jgi:uncharacterized membrane protein YgdD (TMEM256/DUF423 family)
MTGSENTASGRGWIAFAALSGAVSVIVGAFSTHGMDADSQAKEIGWLRTGSLYEILHALAILAVVALSARLNASWARASLWLFVIGSILFPAALYGLALHLPRWLGAVAPIGGSAFILGWVALAVAALTRRD